MAGELGQGDEKAAVAEAQRIVDYHKVNREAYEKIRPTIEEKLEKTKQMEGKPPVHIGEVIKKGFPFSDQPK